VGMTDVVFNLLIFFMLTSTLVHPTALKLLLPKGSTQTSAKPQTTVSITSDLKYYVENQPVNIDDLEAVLKQKLGANPETYIALHVDKTVPFENAVRVMDLAQRNNYKLIIATSPK
jgi:biopolymer transport protein ExbD